MNNEKKCIMIIGAGGSLGSCLCDLLIRNKYKVIAVDIDENSLAYLYKIYNVPEECIYIENLSNFNQLKNIIEYNQVDVVINCAALKHVMWCEYNIKKAIDINVISNLELMNYLNKNDKKFIFISSDKAIKPTNIYALTKQFTDYITKIYNFKLVRGVNFLNSQGSVLDIWDKQRKLNKPFTVVSDKNCNRYFTTIGQMVKVVMIALNDEKDRIEYFPSEVYNIYIKDLFKAYLKLHKIVGYRVNKIPLFKNEKVTEDLNFSPKVIELRNINDIVNILKNI